MQLAYITLAYINTRRRSMVANEQEIINSSGPWPNQHISLSPPTTPNLTRYYEK
jgi:hypothetical protein